MTPDFRATLEMTAQATICAAEDWWVVGSAAVALLGCDAGPVKDIDLMMSARDADAVLRRLGVKGASGAPSDRFRSDVFGTWREPPIPVEIFGGFQIATQDHCQPVVLQTRVEVRVGQARLFVPERAELARLLHQFGRPKDLERARLLTR